MIKIIKRVLLAKETPTIDLIHDTRHLCTRLRTDGITAMSRGFFGGKHGRNHS